MGFFPQGLLQAQTNHTWLCKFILMKMRQHHKFCSTVALSTFQVLLATLCLVATVLDRTERERFYHCRKFHWTALLEPLTCFVQLRRDGGGGSVHGPSQLAQHPEAFSAAFCH